MQPSPPPQFLAKYLPEAQAAYQFPYQLDAPDTSFALAPSLNEFSGLTSAFQNTRLLANNDEVGTVYVLDPNTGQIVDEVPFHKEGDYEGIEALETTVYVTKSTGTIYEIQHFSTEGQTVQKYNTTLDKSFDIESLALDQPNNRLLLGCKSVGANTDNPETWRNIYAFDLTEKRILPQPIYQIQQSALLDYIQNHPDMKSQEKLTEKYDLEEETFDFGISGLAIHPQTRNLYLLSSPGRLLVVMQPKGEIVFIGRLKKSLFPQPEAICFDNKGHLFIGTERKKNPTAFLHRFLP